MIINYREHLHKTIFVKGILNIFGNKVKISYFKIMYFYRIQFSKNY